MTDARGHRAQRPAFVVVVGIHEDDRLAGAHLDDELPHLACLLGPQRQIEARLRRKSQHLRRRDQSEYREK